MAVLDDDQDLTASICSNFLEHGFRATPFHTASELASSDLDFDGYVVDWIVGETSVLSLVATVQRKHATCPIIVLTGQVMSGAVDEGDIADAVNRFNLILHEKPVRTSILIATLTRALSTAHNSAGRGTSIAGTG